MPFTSKVTLVLSIAIALLVICVLGAFFWPGPFFRGYLSAFVLWSEFSLGAAGLLMLHLLVGGRWGRVIRRPLLTGTGTIPVLAVLFVPLLFGLDGLYPWVEKHDGAPAAWFRAFYLSPGFFITRSVGYLILWTVGAIVLVLVVRRSAAQDRPWLRGVAGVGLVLYFLTGSFAAVDWVASLQEHWYSSVMGLYLMTGYGVAALALAILTILQPFKDASERLDDRTMNDLGTLLLALVVLHAYLAYAQVFIIWNGNIPHRIAWYEPRMGGPFAVVSVILIVVHFLLPMFALFFRRVKRSGKALATIAGIILAARALEAVWLVIPAHDARQGLAVGFASLLIIGIGGLWLTLFGHLWRKMPEAEGVVASG